MFNKSIYITAISSNYRLEKDTEGNEQLEIVDSRLDKTWVPNPTVRRRMSRMVRMGVAAGLECLQQQPDVQPGAILTATGLGCLADTEKFMEAILINEEELLTPTAFIQSTFNTVGAQIALLTGNHCYNNTYVHRIFSLESALLDGVLLLAEEEAGHVLVGSVDEVTPSSKAILKRFPLWKNHEPGEGAAFFILSAEPGKDQYGELVDIDLFTGNYSREQINIRIRDILTRQRIDDAIVCYPEEYKSLCGEFFTAVSFPLWTACDRIHRKEYTKPVVICNSFADNHSILVVKPH